MSEVFPTLSRGARGVSEKAAYDPSIRSQMEDGIVLSRRRYTGNKREWSLSFTDLSNADKILLIAMEDTVGVGADTISWTNEDPNDSSTYTVRLKEPISFDIDPTDNTKWLASFTFIEA